LVKDDRFLEQVSQLNYQLQQCVMNLFLRPDFHWAVAKRGRNWLCWFTELFPCRCAFVHFWPARGLVVSASASVLVGQVFDSF